MEHLFGLSYHQNDIPILIKEENYALFDTKNGIAIVNKDKGKNVFIFEGMTDMLSFLQLQKLNNQENKSTLVVLNSVVNVDKFTEL